MPQYLLSLRTPSSQPSPQGTDEETRRSTSDIDSLNDALKSAGWSINDVPERIQRAAEATRQ